MLTAWLHWRCLTQLPDLRLLSPQVRNEFYKDTQGVILVYDVGQKESFDALDVWLAEMKQELGPHGNMENVVFVVCANKVGVGGQPGCGVVLVAGPQASACSQRVPEPLLQLQQGNHSEIIGESQPCV